MSGPYSPPPGDPRAKQRGQTQNIAAAISEISERATLLVREEIELAKAEVSEKATKLVKGAIVAAAAGIFFLMALIFALIGCAWLLYYVLPGSDFTYFWGFFAMAGILVVLGVIVGLIAARAVKRSAPPVPTMAIEEARKIREAVTPTGPPPPVFPAASSPPLPPVAPEPPPAVAPDSPPTVAPEPAPALAPEPDGQAAFDAGALQQATVSFPAAPSGEQA